MSWEQRAWFDKVVPMVDARGSAQRNVSNAVEAGYILEDWPVKPGKSHAEARRAVLAALERYRDREVVRKAQEAFRRAVKDAGLAGRDD